MIGPEPVVIAWLTAAFPTARVSSETPEDLVGNLPYIKVAGLGGGRGRSLGAATVDVECYAATRIAAQDLAGQVDDSLMYRMRGTIAGSTVSEVASISMPGFRPYDNLYVRRFGLTVQVFLRDASPVTVP